jgi:hypothetical protein
MEDVFRFMVLRPAEAVDPQKSTHPDAENPESEFQQSAKQALAAEDPLAAMVEIAQQFKGSERYVSSLGQLSTQLETFRSRLSQAGAIDVKALRGIIQNAFGMAAEDLVRSPEYVQDWQDMADSLIALTITHQEDIPDHAELVQGMRLCGLIERVAARDARLDAPGAIEGALREIVLLPDGIFPLPPARRLPRLSPEQLEALRQERIREEQAAAAAGQRLANLRTALDELKAVRAEDFRPVGAPQELRVEPEELRREGMFSWVTNLFGRRPPTVQAVAAPPMPERSPWILSEEAIAQRLSASTQEQIASLGISLETTPLPELTQVLEAKLMEVGAQVYKPPEPARVVRIGSKFVAVPALSGEAIARQQPDIES